jgi:hypothetical protein
MEKFEPNPYNLYSPPPHAIYLDQDWDSDTNDPFNKIKTKLLPKSKQIDQLNEKLFEFKTTQGKLKLKLKEKELETVSLKEINSELQNKIDSLHELLQKKEKEINKAIFERESYIKAEEEHKKTLTIYRNKEDLYIKEINELKSIQNSIEDDKVQLEIKLKDAEYLIKKLQNTVKPSSRKHRSSIEKDQETSPSRLFKIDTKNFNMQRLKIPERLGTSTSPDRFECNFTERTEDVSYKNICQESMKILGVTEARELYSKLLHLIKYHSEYKKYKKLVDRVSEMIIQCSPQGFFKEKPNLHQIWRWITRMLEEYMKIKQSVTGEAFNKLRQMLTSNTPEEMIEKVALLQKNKIKQF